MKRNMWKRSVTVLMAVAAVALSWAFLWPTQFGGQASWLVVEGNELEPFYTEGDLVIARELGGYPIGSLAAVDGVSGPTLATVEEGTEQILGAPWLQVAGLGTLLAVVASVILSWPFLLAVAVAVLAAALLRIRSRRSAADGQPVPTVREDHVLAS